MIRALACACAWLACAVAMAEDAGARRIVSLAPNLTELAFAAGAGPRLVGVSEYSDHPQAARRIARIGDAFRIDYERVLGLRPDLVLAWESGTPVESIERLRALGLRVAVIRADSLAGVGGALTQVGREAGTLAAASAARARYEARRAALARQYAGRRRLSVFIEIGDQPLYTVSGRHLISEMVSTCGGDNVFAALPSLAPPVDVEAVVARDPQVILIADGTAAAARAAWALWPGLTAVRQGTVLEVPADLVARATPRALDGLAAVCAALDSARARLGAGKG